MPEEPAHRAELVQRVRTLSGPMEPIATGERALLRELPGVRVVAFDVYGTLLTSGTGDVGTASARDRPAAMAAALADAGVAQTSVTQAIAPRAVELLQQTIRQSHTSRRADGIDHPEVDIRRIWRRVLDALEADGVDFTADDATVERLAVEYECRVNPVWPMPGAADVLETIRATGRTLAIVSNAQFYTPLVLHALLGQPVTDLGFAPDRCVWSYTMLEGKPSTVLYQRLLDRLHEADGVSPDEVLYIGNDVRNDIWPASTLGCRTALFAGDQRSLRLREDDPDCAGVRADAVVTELNQLNTIIAIDP